MSRNLTARSAEPSRGMGAHPSVMAGREGYAAARAGLPLDYDAYPTQALQGSYEIGRLWAVNMKAAGLPIPAWPAGRNVPAAVKAQLSLSLVMVGGCQPGWDDGRNYPGCRLAEMA